MPKRIVLDINCTWGYLRYQEEGPLHRYPTGRTRRQIICICDPNLGGCGNIKKTYIQDLRAGRVKSCGCFQRQMGVKLGTATGLRVSEAAAKAYSDPNAKTGAFTRTYNGYVKGAEYRNIPFELSKDECHYYFKLDCFYCSDGPSNRSLSSPRSDLKYTYNGIDRIDNNLGYIIGNVVSCCKICNYAKRDLDFLTFINWINRIVANKDKFRIDVSI